MNLFSYFKLLKFKRGITLQIEPTFRCNQNCPYCINKNGGTEFPKDINPMTKDEWINYIETFPLKIGEIIIGGGEPTLYFNLVNFVNYLLKKGYFVQLFTNLTHPEILNKINKSIRFRIIATYHEGQISVDTFLKNLSILNHPVQSQSFSPLKVTRIINKWTDKEKKEIISCLRVAPDGAISTNCWDQHQKYL